MTQRNGSALKKVIHSLGFPRRMDGMVDYHRNLKQQDFALTEFREIQKDRMTYELHFTASDQGVYRLTDYTATLQNEIAFPDVWIGRINVAQLDSQMRQADHWYDEYYDGSINELTLSENRRRTEAVLTINEKMEHLFSLEGNGKEFAKLLLYKYRPEAEYSTRFPDYRKMQEQYEYTCTVNVYGDTGMKAVDAYEFLKNTIASGYLDRLESNITNHQNIKNMEDKNFEYLKDNIKYMGFGEGLNQQLESNLKQGMPEFNLNFKTEVNKKPFEAELHFRKPDNSEMYFFNSYKATVQKTNGENVDQTFYLNKGKGVTAKEAYNMLEGRSVFKELSNKEGVPYKAWINLDFDNKDKHNNHEVKQFHENYGYDVKAAVSKYPVAELKDPEKEKTLMQSLQKGNIQSVTLEKDGKDHKMFIEANPQYKTVNLYDGQMKRMPKETLEQFRSVKQSQGQDVKQEEKKEIKEEIKKGPKQKATDDLDHPKKKTSHKKGMSV